MLCHNSLLWPVHLGWPCMAWLIASLSYASPFTMTRQWSMKGHPGLGGSKSNRTGVRQRHTGKTPCDNRGRDWNDAAANQGAPRNDSHHQKVDRGKEGFRILPRISEGAWPCWHLDFRLLACRSGTKETYVLLSYPNFGTLLWQR